MNNLIVGTTSFLAGLAVGSIGMYASMNKRFEEFLDAEIENIKNYYEEKMKTDVQEYIKNEMLHIKESEVRSVNSKDTDEDATMIDYSKYSREEKPKKQTEMVEEEKEPVINKKDPDVIPPNEFGSEEGYEIISLIYYADGVLADEYNEIADIDRSIGRESLKHFGEYEEDAIHVRNRRLGVDYEILKDLRTFEEVLNDGPGKIE